VDVQQPTKATPGQQVVPAPQHATVTPVLSEQQGPLQQTVVVGTARTFCAQQVVPDAQQVGPVEAAQRAVVASHVPLQQTLPEAQHVPGVPQQLAPTSQQMPLQQT
jgi:hypothetical protein